MTWSKFEDRTRRHPKVVKAGNDAAAFWQWAVMYSNENGLDGYLAEEVLHIIPPLPIHPLKARRLAQRCADAIVKPGGLGLLERVDGGYLIHDFHVYQPSADEEEQRREKKREAGRLGGLRSGVVRRGKHEPPDQPTDEAPALSNGKHPVEAKTNPVPFPSRIPSQIPPTPHGGARAAAQTNGSSAHDEPEVESGYDLACRIFLPAWAGRYGREYELSPHTGLKSESQALMRIGRRALELEGEKTMREWVKNFLADNDDWLREQKHPIRGLEARLNKYLGTQPPSSGVDENVPPKIANPYAGLAPRGSYSPPPPLAKKGSAR